MSEASVLSLVPFLWFISRSTLAVEHIRDCVLVRQRLRQIQSLIQIQKSVRIISHLGIDLSEGGVNAGDGNIVLGASTIQWLVRERIESEYLTTGQTK